MEMHLYTTKKSTTAGNIAFLLLSFPLGLIYFLVTIIGFVVGMSTLILWIGLPILFATLILVRGMATLERRMATNLLHVSFPYQQQSYDMLKKGFWRRFGSMLRDPLTWTSAIYMILKLPLGIISFTLALVLPVVSLAITLLPLVYLVNLLATRFLLNGLALLSGEIARGLLSTGEEAPEMLLKKSRL